MGRLVNSAENCEVSSLLLTSGSYISPASPQSTKGTGSSLRSSFSQSMLLKNGCRFTSSASVGPPPSRFVGSFCSSYVRESSQRHLLQEVGGVGRHVRRDVHAAALDLVEQPLLVATVEGRLRVTWPRQRHPARQHLVQQRAQRPPVDRAPVARAVQDLRRQVLWRAAEGLCAAVRLTHALLAEPEVGETHVAFLRQQHVLGLQVSA